VHTVGDFQTVAGGDLFLFQAPNVAVDTPKNFYNPLLELQLLFKQLSVLQGSREGEYVVPDGKRPLCVQTKSQSPIARIRLGVGE